MAMTGETNKASKPTEGYLKVLHLFGEISSV